MFHTKITPNVEVGTRNTGEIALLAFFAAHDEALGHSAVLLAGRRGTRLVNAIREGLGQPRPFTRRICRHLLELRDLLFLEHVHDEEREETACFAVLDPEDAIVLEICLLADVLEDALRTAGFITASDDLSA